jgi:hypothetical protein
MGTSFFILSIGAAASVHAAAPDSVGDSLYREDIGQVGIRVNLMSSIKLFADGAYRENWVREGSTITRSIYGYPGDYGTPVSGTYTYSKTSDTTATLTFYPADASGIFTRSLTFTNATAGTTFFRNNYTDSTSRGGDGTFTLDGPRGTAHALVVISTRVHVHATEPTIVGFIVGRDGDFLVRVIGPTLRKFGLNNPWAAPSYQLFNSQKRLEPWGPLTGDPQIPRMPPPWDWNLAYRAMHLQAFAATGLFDLDAGSKDIATVVPLAPGAYTVVLLPDADDPGGDALVEVTEIP